MPAQLLSDRNDMHSPSHGGDPDIFTAMSAAFGHFPTDRVQNPFPALSWLNSQMAAAGNTMPA